MGYARRMRAATRTPGEFIPPKKPPKKGTARLSEISRYAKAIPQHIGKTPISLILSTNQRAKKGPKTRSLYYFPVI